MASMTMTTSFLASTAATKQLPTTTRRCVVVVRASRDYEKVVANTKEENNNSRRGLMLGVVATAATAFSVAKVAMADEPKRGTPDAKKKYAPICVTMPTARICRN